MIAEKTTTAVTPTPRAEAPFTNRPSASFLSARYVYIDGMRIYSAAWSSDRAKGRPPIIMLHGVGVSGRYLEPTAALLANRRSVYIPDLPGFGQSDKPVRAPGITEIADFTAAYMDTIGIREAAVVAHSFGCDVAIDLALRHPNRVTKLILAGPTGDPFNRKGSALALRLFIDALLEPKALIPYGARTYLQSGIRRFWRTVQFIKRNPIVEKLPLIKLPILFVRGSHDPLFSQRWANRALGLLPRSRLVVIDGAAHAVTYSKPAEFSRAVEEFLRT